MTEPKHISELVYDYLAYLKKLKETHEEQESKKGLKQEIKLKKFKKNLTY